MRCDNVQLRSCNDCSRIHRISFRDVTDDLPDFPDEYWGDNKDGEIPKGAEGIIPDTYKRGRWFYIEIHVRGWGWYGPIAHATVHVDEDTVDLIGMFVIDGLRQQGYGRALIESVAERWPNVTWQGCSAARQFMDRLVEQGVAIKTDEVSNTFGYSAHFKFGRGLGLPFPGNNDNPMET